MGVEELLREAAETGEIVTVIYHGGSQPGTKRRLAPITVTAREIRARDIPTGEVKNFLLSKIESRFRRSSRGGLRRWCNTATKIWHAG